MHLFIHTLLKKIKGILKSHILDLKEWNILKYFVLYIDECADNKFTAQFFEQFNLITFAL